jgi:ABC-type Fe3+/spermidine/putrescine transport system ATPase subunit
MSDLRVLDFSKTYKHSKGNDRFSIRSISLEIREGESFAILGPSGCGKTTLLKCIAGLLQPDKGNIRIGEENILPLPAEKRGFGMVLQESLLFPHMTVIENVAFGLKMQGWGKKERIGASQEVLAAVGLSGYDYRYPNELSGGQQRVALARAIVTKPKLLLLDEPFSALDPDIRGEMRQLVKDLHKQFRISMLFVTHDQDEAFEIADRIAIMHKGEILQTGSPMDVYTKPNHPFVARFIGSGNVIEGELHQGVFQSGDFHLELTLFSKILSGTGWLVIRPELFRSVTSVEEAQMSGILKDVKFRHGYYHLQVDTGNLTIHMLKNMQNKRIPQVGDMIYLTLDASQIHFIPNIQYTADEQLQTLKESLNVQQKEWFNLWEDRMQYIAALQKEAVYHHGFIDGIHLSASIFEPNN